MNEKHVVGVRGQAGPGAPGQDDAVDAAGIAAPSHGDLGTPESAAAVEGSAAASVDGDLEELLEKASQRDAYLALAQRTQADFENYRKRVARDGAIAESRGLTRLVRELLPALDNLDRALAAAADADQALIEGLKLVQRELQGALERAGVEAYGAPGEKFDPEHHEAVAQQPIAGHTPGEIVEVYQPGYRLAGGVIRPARVLVAG